MPFTPLSDAASGHARLLRTMLDASLHGVLVLQPVYDTRGTITDFVVEAGNEAIRNQVGFLIEPERKPLLSEIFPSYKQHGFFDLYVDVLESSTVQRSELYYADERIHGWFDVGVAPEKDLLVVSFVNITDRKRYQQRTQEAVQQLEAIMNVVQAGIFTFLPVLNDEGDLTDFRFGVVNPFFASYVGQTPEKLHGDLGSRWFPAYQRNGLFEKYRDTYENGRTNRFEFHYDDDGIDVWLDIQSTPLGEGILVTYTDYTPVKKLQLKMEKMVGELSRSNEHLEEFAYAASHDLQEPLRKIHYFSNNIKERYQDVLGSEGASLLGRMENATRRMRRLIDDLLAYSRVSARHTEREQVDLTSVLQEVLVDLETRITEKNARIDADGLPAVEGDRAQLQQLLQNLLGNALKYTREGVAPEVRVRCSEVPGQSIATDWQAKDPAKSYYCIEVSDNGLGFDQEHALKIFQLFQRLHGRSEFEGTGIGLAIAQKVADNHKGHIAATGRPGAGATFTLFLPKD